jgi:uncharacterized protein
MRDFRDAKAMAQTLRDALKAKSVSLTHGESLELVARTLGFHNWNVLSAKIQSEHQGPVAKSDMAMPDTAASPVFGSMPVVAMRDIVLFPKKMVVPVFVGRDRSQRAVERAMASDKRIVAVTQRKATDDDPNPDALYDVGVTASVIDLESLVDGTMRLVLKSLDRATIARWGGPDPFLTAEIVPLQELRAQESEAFALTRAALDKLKTIPSVRFPFYRFERIETEPSVVADAIASFLTLRIDQKQDLLETNDVVARLMKVHSLIEVDQAA